MVKDKLKIFDYEAPLDESWHLLMVNFIAQSAIKGGGHAVKIYIDSLSRPINPKMKHAFSKKNEHIFAYGCDAREIMDGLRVLPKPTQDLVSLQVSSQIINIGQNFMALDYFQGCMSLPFLLNKFDVEKIDKQNDQMRRSFTDFLIESLTKKLIVNISTNELSNYLRAKGKMPAKEAGVPTFEPHDFNEEVILRHQRACSIEHLATIHF